MSKLNSLNLVAYERPSNNNPTLKWVTDADGERKRIEVPKRVKQWWGKDANGNTVLTVRYGSKPLELAKGKQAIKLTSNDDVVKTLRVIAEAVEAGELDAVIEQQATMPKLKTKAK